MRRQAGCGRTAGGLREVLFALCVGGVAAGQGTVFDVTAHGVAPRTSSGIVVDAGAPVRALVAAIAAGTGPAAGAAGPFTIYFPGSPGGATIYDFATTGTVSGNVAHLPLVRSVTAAASPLDDLVLQGDPDRPVELRFHDLKVRGLTLTGCRRVRVADLALRFEAPPFLSGTIDALGQNDATTSWVELTVAPGDPLPDLAAPTTDPYLVAPTYLIPFDPATRLMRDGGEQLKIVATASFVGGAGWIQRPYPAAHPRTFRLLVPKTTFLPSAPHGQHAEVGDLVVWKNALANAVATRETDGCALERVAIRSSGSAAVYSSFDAALRLAGLRVEPVGDALLSSNLDGLHCKDARVGPHVVGCSFARTGDDVVAVAGSWMEVVAPPPGLAYAGIPNAVVFRSRVRFPFRGPAAAFTFDLYDGAPNAAPRFARLAAGLHSTAIQFAGTYAASGATYQVFEIGFAAGAAPATFPGDLAVCLDYLGADALIEGNAIRDHRARGVFVKGPRAVVRGNRVENAGGSGILAGPELGPFYEASFVDGLTIEGNELVNVCRGDPDAAKAGAIAVAVGGQSAPGAPFDVDLLARNNGNVVVRDNRVTRAAQAGLFLAGAHDVDVRDNRFVGCQYRPLGPAGATGYGYGVDEVTAVVHVQNGERATLRDNLVETGAQPFHGSFFASAGSIAAVEASVARCWHAGFEPLESDETPAPFDAPVAPTRRGGTKRFHNGVLVEFRGFGTALDDPAAPFRVARGRQSAYAPATGAELAFDAVPCRAIEFAWGADARDGAMRVEVVVEPRGGPPTAVATCVNDRDGLPGEVAPYWTTKVVDVPKALSGPLRVSIRRRGSSTATLYVDDVLLR